MLDTADEVEKNNTCWTLIVNMNGQDRIVNKDEQDMLDNADEVRT